MAFTAFNNPGLYNALYGDENCTDCGDSSSTQKDTVGCKECSCCPPGLIEQRDENGKVIACLTPNDGQGFMITQYKCPDGKVKVIDADGNFVGCLSVDDYITWKNAQTP
jgi:hypothetical protein